MNFRYFVVVNRVTLTFSATLFLSLLSPESFFWPLHVGIALLLVCLPTPTFCRWAIISGLVIGSFHFLAYENRQIPPECFDSALNFQGTIADFPRTLSSITGEQITFVVLESLTLVDGSCDRFDRVTASLVADSELAIEDLKPPHFTIGQIISGSARLKHHDYRWTKGGLPGNLRHLADDIDARWSIESFSLHQPATRHRLTSLRSLSSQRIDEGATSESAARHLQALLLGRQDRLTDDDWLNLRTMGMTHAFVVSGLHVGLVALWSYAILGFPRRLGAIHDQALQTALMTIGVAGITLAYVLLTGASLPAKRAFLMLVGSMLFRTLLWTPHPLGIVCTVGAALLAANPWAGLTPSFWLSLVMTGVIINETARPAASRLRTFLRLHIVIALVSSVLTTLFFGQVTLASLLTNLILVPLLTAFTLPIGLLGLVAEGVGLEAGRVALRVSSLSVDLLMTIFESVLSATEGWLLHGVPFHWGVFCLCAIVLSARLLPGKARIGAICLLCLFLSTARGQSSKTTLHVLDVGQGTLVFVRSPKMTMLYDTGGVSFQGRPAIDRRTIKWLKQIGVSRLDLLVVSHGDLDHAGGLSLVRREFDVVSHHGFGGVPCRPGQEIGFDRHITVRFLSGTGQLAADKNADSCVLALEMRDASILLPGDIPTAVELDILAARKIEKPITLLVAAHHGSKTSSSRSFIDHTEPANVVFTSRFGNQFGHPDVDIVNRYRRRGVKVWSTGSQGDVTLRFNVEGAPNMTVMRHKLIPYWAEGPQDTSVWLSE